MAEVLTHTSEATPSPGFKMTEIGEIPKDWGIAAVRDLLVEADSGFASGARDENGIIQLRMNNIGTDGRIVEKPVLKVPVLRDVNRYIPQVGDILFNNTNSVDLIGKTVMYRGEFKRCVYSNHITRLRIDPAKTIPEWLLYHFIELWHKGMFVRLCVRHVGQAGINKDVILKIKLPLPALPEQRKIVTVLSTVDENIQKTRQIMEKAEELKKGLTQQLLTCGIGHTRFKRSEIGEIPEEWKVVTLGNVVEQHDGIRRGPWGGSIKKEIFVIHGFKVYEQQNVIDNDFSIGRYFIDDEKYREMQAFSVKAGDILISAAGTIGKCVIVPEGAPEGIINQALIRIRVNQLVILAEYFKAVVEHVLQKVALKTVSQGAVLQNLASVKQLRSILVPAPPIIEQQRIISLLNTYNGKVALERERLNQLEELKKGLMQVLLTGKVRVKTS